MCAQAKTEKKFNIELVAISPVRERRMEGRGPRSEPIAAVNSAVVGRGGRIKRRMVEALERDSAGRPTPIAEAAREQALTPVDEHVATPLGVLDEQPAEGSIRGSSGRGSVSLHTPQASVHEASVHIEPPPSAQPDPDANPDPANVERPASETGEQTSTAAAEDPPSYNVAINANEPEALEETTPPPTS